MALRTYMRQRDMLQKTKSRPDFDVRGNLYRMTKNLKKRASDMGFELIPKVEIEKALCVAPTMR